MKKRDSDLPPRVFRKNGSFWLVRAEGKGRKWVKLCREREGLPAMYRELAKLHASVGADDMVPMLVATWLAEVSARRSRKTQANDAYMAREIADGLADFRADQVTPPAATTFLARFKGRPRTFNAYRSTLRDLMRFAEEKGHRPAGSNPVDCIPTARVKARDRYLTDSEVRRIKAAACRGADGHRTRSGHTIACMIDMAYLTGQRVGDLLALQWSAMRKEGILFEPGKTEESTGVRILIQWTPRLEALVESLRKPPPIPGRKQRAKPVSVRWVFSSTGGAQYTYSAIRSAWLRACERAGVKNAHFHDMRARALTDKDAAEGMRAARTMGGHSTEQQTSDYVRHKKPVATRATR